VRQGGAIVCAAECRDGFPEHGSYREELTGAASPAALLEAIAVREQIVPDQWQIQIQAAIQARSRVIVHTSYLSDAELAAAHLEQTPDVEGTVRELLDEAGPDARLCVLPYGPLTVPYVG
jgi:nickel-dependent lactate racemase